VTVAVDSRSHRRTSNVVSRAGRGAAGSPGRTG
jgi:hypothetical protein